MLYKLPNGNYIDPRTVTGVAYLPGHLINFDGPEVMDRVRIDTALVFGIELVEFGSAESAEQFRDEFAAACNPENGA